MPYFFVDNSLLSVSCSVLFCFFLFISITYHVFKFPKRQTVSFPNSTTYHPKSKTGKKTITLTHGKRLRNHVALIDKSEISCGSSSLKDLTPTTDRSCWKSSKVKRDGDTCNKELYNEMLKKKKRCQGLKNESFVIHVTLTSSFVTQGCHAPVTHLTTFFVLVTCLLDEALTLQWE